VCPGRETSTHYFSCSGGTGTYSTKSTSGHISSYLCFFIQWDMQVMWCSPVRPGCERSMNYFSFLGGTGTVSTKLHWDTFFEPVFLYPVGYAGIVVHSSASET
jgi:hypothetical protein